MRLEGRHELDGRYTLERSPDGLYVLLDGADRVYSHQSRQAVMHHYAGLVAPPVPVAPATAAETLLNDTVAHIVNVWGPYEMPRFGLHERVKHNPSGKLCRVIAFGTFAPPILLYGLEEVGGAAFENYCSVTDLSHVCPHGVDTPGQCVSCSPCPVPGCRIPYCKGDHGAQSDRAGDA